MLVFLITSCQTFQEVHKSLRTERVSLGYSSCGGLSGDHLVRWYNGTNIVGELQLEWASDSFSYISGSLLNPLGAEVFSFGSYKNGFYAHSRSKKKRMSLEENDHGFLTYQGYDLLLKSNEISCLLSKKTPLSWKEKIEKSSDVFNIKLEEAYRTIEIESVSKNKTCMKFYKPFLWFFSSNVSSVCYSSEEEGGGVEFFFPQGWRVQIRDL